jgi:hypothetical protein
MYRIANVYIVEEAVVRCSCKLLSSSGSFKNAIRPGSSCPCHTALIKVDILVDIPRFCWNGNVHGNLFQKRR